MSQHHDDLDEVCNEGTIGQIEEVPEGHWKTRFGTVIKISEMSTDHIFNAIRHIERNCIRRYTAIVNYTKKQKWDYRCLEDTLLNTSDKYVDLIQEYNRRENQYEPWHWLKNPPVNGVDRALYYEDVKNGRYTYDFHTRTGK